MTEASQTSLLISNAHSILTGRTDDGGRATGPDIRIVDGRILAIGKLTALPGERVLDATDCMVHPAWVNTHHHLFQSLLKSDPGGLNLPLTEWLAATPYRYRASFDEKLFRLAARIGLVELAGSGCGTVADHHYLYYPDMPYDSSAILFEGAEALGLRFVLCHGGATQTCQLEAELPSALRSESLQSYQDDVARLAARYHDSTPDAMRRIVMASTTPLYSVQPAELRELAAFGRSLGLRLRLHSHLSETVEYQQATRGKFGCSPVAFVAEHDWLGPDVWYAHLVKLDAEEIALLGLGQHRRRPRARHRRTAGHRGGRLRRHGRPCAGRPALLCPARPGHRPVGLRRTAASEMAAGPGSHGG